MAVHVCTNVLHSTHTVLSSLRPYPANPSSTTLVRTRISCLSSSSSSPRMNPQTKFMEFPHVSAPIRDLMLGLVSSVETHLGSSLLPCSLPPDVQYYQNPNGNAEGTVFVRSAIPSSPVLDFLKFILPFLVFYKTAKLPFFFLAFSFYCNFSWLELVMCWWCLDNFVSNCSICFFKLINLFEADNLGCGSFYFVLKWCLIWEPHTSYSFKIALPSIKQTKSNFPRLYAWFC